MTDPTLQSLRAEETASSLPPDAVDLSMTIDRARLLLDRAPLVFLGAMTAAVGMASVLQSHQSPEALWAWVMVVLGVHLLRLAVSYLASQKGVLERAPQRWLFRLRLSVFAAGAVWAPIPLWLYPAAAPAQWFATLVLSAVAGAGMATLAMDTASAMLFILPFAVPVIARLVLADLPLLQMAGVLSAFYAIYLFSASWQMQKMFRELTLLRAQAANQARVDHLTGLPNRVGLRLDLERALARSQRAGSIVAVGYIDLDDFKQVNDRHGHAAGDALLQQLAQRWRQELRASESIARLGGDEFVILIEDLDAEVRQAQIEAVAMRIHRAVEMPFAVTGTHAPARVGMTMGVACFPDHGETPDMLLRQADAAMYQSKQRKTTRAQWWQFSERSEPN